MYATCIFKYEHTLSSVGRTLFLNTHAVWENTNAVWKNTHAILRKGVPFCETV